MSITLDEQIKRLKQAIAELEAQRSILGDEAVEAALVPSRQKLAELVAQNEPSEPESPVGQRKVVTILFMDLVGSTEMTRHLDPEDQMAVIDPVITRLAEKVSEFGGHVARFQGDGFKAVFGLPLARENDPEQAIRAGLAIQEEAPVIAAKLESEHGITGFNVRVGITTGLVFAGGDTEGEDTIKGSPVNLAARLESSAEPGSVLISYDTYKHVRGIFVLEQWEDLQVKGFSDPVQVYKVLDAKPRAFYRGKRLVEGVETRMIGRDAELETLKDTYCTVVEDGEPQIVTIVGEAGIGKSRLLYEFENWVDLQPADMRLFRGRAHLESQRLPYDLLRSIFAFRFNIQEDDPLEVVQEKWLVGFQEVFDATQGVDTNLEMQEHILGQLLGYDFSDSPHVKPLLGEPQQMRDRSMVYLAGYFKAAAKIMPVLMLLEDLHWADDSSLDALSQLGLELQDTPVLIVSAARPGLYERRTYWFEGRKFHSRLNLMPLSRRANRNLVSEVLQMVPEIPDSLRELILTNSEGNPFYVEELVKVLVEAGVILTREPQWIVDEEQLDQTDVPATLTGVLQARLERLPKEERTLIQQASVVGRVFWDQAVWYLNYQGDGSLEEQGVQDGLVDLRGREMIYRRELSAFQDAKEYIFKNAVLRQVTYESVLKKLRRIYHALAAEWLMEQRGGRTGEVVGLIADHLELAGENDEAIRYLKLAGESAGEKFANEEAVDYISRALALIPDDDLESRFELLLAREEVLDLQASREEQRHDLKELAVMTENLGSVEKQMEVGVRWSKFLWQTSDFQAAADMADRVVEQAEVSGNLYFVARGHFHSGMALFRLDQFELASKHLDMALDGFRATGDQRQQGFTLRNLGAVAAGLVDFKAWQEYSQQALKIARQIGDRSDEAEALNHLGHVASYLGDYSSAQRYFGQYLALAREIGSRFQEKMALQNLGWVTNDMKDFATARDYYEHALIITQAISDRSGEANSLVGLGDALAGLEKWNPATEAYLAAKELFEGFGSESGVAGSHSGLARVELAKGDEVRALKLVDEILEYLERYEGILERLRESYLTCVLVLQVANDPRASEVLEIAHTRLQDTSEKIEDQAMRRSFLENVPYNRELVKLWEEQQHQG